jgi:hypothetical protein
VSGRGSPLDAGCDFTGYLVLPSRANAPNLTVCPGGPHWSTTCITGRDQTHSPFRYPMMWFLIWVAVSIVAAIVDGDGFSSNGSHGPGCWHK